jgi:eukaryotic-like serine/threonine-protein kinase
MHASTDFFQRYELGPRLGSSAAAETWRALDTQQNRQVVVSLSNRSNDLSAVERERFQREAQILAKLTHPHLAAILDYGIDEGRPYIVSEYCEGTDLLEAVRQFPSPQRRSPRDMQMLAEIALSICEAVGLAHRAGLIHGGIQPSRIRVAPDGRCKVVGFNPGRLRNGLAAKESDPADWIYASPEQAAGRPLSAASDVYSLGVLMYEIFTGRPPFTRKNAVSLAQKHLAESPPAPGKINPALPAGLEEIILRSMAKDPADRFRNGEQMARVLRAYCAEDAAAEEAPDEEGIDWRVVGLIFVLIVAWGGLIPLWMYVYFLYNPPGA